MTMNEIHIYRLLILMFKLKYTVLKKMFLLHVLKQLATMVSTLFGMRYIMIISFSYTNMNELKNYSYVHI